MAEYPKVAALYCVYGDFAWLPISYRSVYPCVDRIYFFLSSKPWYGEAVDNTELERVVQLLADPENKVVIKRGAWNIEVEQRNHSLEVAERDGFQYGLIVDADEVYDPEVLKAGIEYAAARPHVGCWHVKWITYWKSLKFRIDPIEPYDPPILVQLGRGKFVETRNILANKHELIPPGVCMCHHLSYCHSDESIKRKHIFAPGHSQSMALGWYENVWRAWDSDKKLTNLHPVNPSIYQRAVPVEPHILPPLLQAASRSKL